MELQIISEASITGMIISAILAIGFPIILLIVGKKKYNAKLSSFFIGAAVFFVMALILEQGLHSIVFILAGEAIQSNIFVYALYGGACAAIFEEVGRFVALKYILKEDCGFENAFMYGVGHGGCESIIIVGITMISNVATSLMINAGTFPNTLELLDEETRSATYAQLEALWTTPSYQFYLGGVERIFAIILQIGFTLIMYEAVKNHRKDLFILPFILHFVVDFVSVVLKDFIPLAALEALIAVMSVCVFMMAHSISKKLKE